MPDTTTVQMTLSFQTSIFIDLLTHWSDQKGEKAASTLDQPIGAADASMTLGGPTTIAAGDAVVIGQDVAIVTHLEPGSKPVLSIVRAPVAGMVATSHLAGEVVQQLKYSDPMKMLLAESLQPYALNVVHALAQENRATTITPATASLAIV